MEGQIVKFHLIEGEEITALVPYDTLYVQTNLGRIFKSIAPVEQIDFVEVKL